MSARKTAFAIAVVAAAGSGTGPDAAPGQATRMGRRAVARPLAFEPNVGQSDPRVRFLARTDGGTLLLAADEAVVSLRGGALRTRIVGADCSARVEGLDALPGKSNYFRGSDPSHWITDVPTFARVRCRDAYPGVDVVWYSRDGRPEYDLVVAAGADVSAVELAFDGARSIEVDAAGDLVLRVGDTTIRQRRPVVFEESAGARREIAARYVLASGGRVRFDFEGRDPSRVLVVDPQIDYGTYLGGSGVDRSFAFARDASGNFYVSGYTTSADYPTLSAFQPTYGGTGQFGDGDAFVTKLDPTGSTALYSTYLGGSDDDRIAGIAVDGLGAAYVAGQTHSTNFPTTPGAFQTANAGQFDAVVAKLAPSGSSLVYSTYVGGFSDDAASAMALHGSNVVFTGQGANQYPTTVGAFQRVLSGQFDAVVTELNSDGTSLVYSTLLGGSGIARGLAIAVDATGLAYVAGYTNSTDFPSKLAYQQNAGGGLDGFVARIDASGTALGWSTYLGGNGEEIALGIGLGAAVPAQHVYVAGSTRSTDLATVAPFQAQNGGGQDCFLAEFDGTTGAAVHVSYLGGAGEDLAYAVSEDAVDGIWVAGGTSSSDFPTAVAQQPQLAGGSDAFVLRIDDAFAALDYSSYFGGTGDDYAFALQIDAATGTPFISGQTESADLPTTVGAFQTTAAPSTNAFLATPHAPAPPAIASFFLPRTVKAKANAKTPAKSKLLAVGGFDTGPDEPNLASAATLDVGGLHFDIPGLTPKGKSFRFAGGGAVFSITPRFPGSSRATFSLKFTGDLTGKIAFDAPLDLHFKNASSEGVGTVRLSRGSYAFGKVRGALVAPNLYTAGVRATLKGAGKDKLLMRVGLATNGVTPPAASDLTVRFADRLDVTIPAASFKRKGDADVFVGNVGGITSAIVDHAREKITIVAKGLTLGTFSAGGNSVTVAIGLGVDLRAVAIRMALVGRTVRY